MKTQNYQNHSRYYTPHHFVFYPVAIFLLITSLCGAVMQPQNLMLWLVLSATIVLVGWLSFMLRQHYALGNQNRIVRLELRFRYYVLTQKRFEILESQLSGTQVYALRFASDEELPALADRAVKENLSADEIKKSVKNWQPDYRRV